jgi:hypothetical protein
VLEQHDELVAAQAHGVHLRAVALSRAAAETSTASPAA